MKRKSLLAVGLASVLCFSLGAATGTKVHAYLNSTNFMANGKLVEIQTLSYNNQMYLPLRDAAKMMNGTAEYSGNAVRIESHYEGTEQVNESQENSSNLNSSFSRENPAPIGTRQVLNKEGKSYALTVLSSERGATALKKIKAANMFNKDPEAGKEYVLLKLKFEYLAGGGSASIGNNLYSTYSSDGFEYKGVSVVAPSPTIFSKVAQGKSTTGYIVFMVDKTDKQPKLGYGMKNSSTEGIWFRI